MENEKIKLALYINNAHFFFNDYQHAPIDFEFLDSIPRRVLREYWRDIKQRIGDRITFAVINDCTRILNRCDL